MRRSRLSDKMAKIAAKWWADRLREGAKLDNADPSETGFMTFMLGKMLQAKIAQGRTLEQIEAFEEALYRRLLDYDRYWLGIDYHPWGLFIESAEEAGFELSSTCLPWKTNMYFEESGEIKVSYGYGALLKTILEPHVR